MNEATQAKHAKRNPNANERRKEMNEATQAKHAQRIANNLDIGSAIYEETRSYFSGHELSIKDDDAIQDEVARLIINKLRAQLR
jgi:hypothetical protein